MSQDANYRKHNDGSLNSSTYHKKDGTNVRAQLKEELLKEEDEAASKATISFPAGTIISTVSQEEADRLIDLFEEVQQAHSKKEEPI